MYDDSQVNNNIPRFDSQTGEPLFPQADSVQNVQADTDVNAATVNYNQNVQADADVNSTGCLGIRRIHMLEMSGKMQVHQAFQTIHTRIIILLQLLSHKNRLKS